VLTLLGKTDLAPMLLLLLLQKEKI